MAETKTALLDAAQRAFAEQGYRGTSIRRLAAEVGIKESSVYNHFASKEALLQAVVERAESRLAAVADQLEVPFGAPQDAVPFYAAIDGEGLLRAASAFVTAWLTDADVVAARRVLTLEQYRTPSAGRLLHALLVERPLAFQSELFAGLIRRGSFRSADPDAVALAFWGPVVAILAAADARQDAAAALDEALVRLRRHLEHFATCHATAWQPR